MYTLTLHNDEYPDSIGYLGRHHSRRQVQAVVDVWLNSEWIMPESYIIATLGGDVLLDTREGNVFRKHTDKEWAFLYGLSIDQFLGKEELPEPDLQSLPCGQDDYVGEVYEAARQVIRLRKEWGEDTDRCEDFGEFVRKYWIE